MYNGDTTMYIVTPIGYDEALERARNNKPVYFVECNWDLNYIELDENMLMSMPAIDEFGSGSCWSSGFSKVNLGEPVDVSAGKHIFTFCEPKAIEDLQELIKWMWRFNELKDKKEN